jgi:response regulator RpfG family c-di-GMP phosphodiesterase
MPEDAVRVEALVAILRTEDEAMARRALRVAHFAGALGQAMGLSESELSALECAAVLRDIRRLDVHGIARNVRFLAEAESIVTATEEKFDGTGFPMGLKGSSIPRGARVLAVAEAYEAMVWGAGHGQLPPATAVETLRAARAHEFDPEVLQALTFLPQKAATFA